MCRLSFALTTLERGSRKRSVIEDISYYIKNRIYCVLIIPIAFYACETWTLRIIGIQRLSEVENNCLGAMGWGKISERIKMVVIRKKKRILKL